MKKTILALALSLASMSAISQTESEFIKSLSANFNATKAVQNVICGTISTTVRVQRQRITIINSSKNKTFDEQVLKAINASLEPGFEDSIEFPVTVKKTGCSQSIDWDADLRALI